MPRRRDTATHPSSSTRTGTGTVSDPYVLSGTNVYVEDPVSKTPTHPEGSTRVQLEAAQAFEASLNDPEGWFERAQGNPHAIAPIYYYPADASAIDAYVSGLEACMSYVQEFYHTVAGATFRRLPAISVQATKTLAELQALGGASNTFKEVLTDCDTRGLVDASGVPIKKCGTGTKARGYVIFVPGAPTLNIGGMIGFEHPCGNPATPPTGANLLWPRPGMTGLTGKGLELICDRSVNYHTLGQLDAYDPVTETYLDEWWAETKLQWTGAMAHEIGHMFNLPHPPDNRRVNTIMYSWWDIPTSTLLPEETNAITPHLMLR